MASFTFSENIILEDNDILLRPLQRDDFNHLLHFAKEEPELWKYSLVQANSEENLINYIDLSLDGRASEKEYPFIVFDKINNEYAGSTRFYDIQLTNQTLQLGYTWYGNKFQGTGLNKRCKFLLLEFAFEKLGIERVEFRADNDNKRSIAAMKSIGCQIEGILRSNGKRENGSRRDSIVLSILKDEWQTNVKNTLLKKIEK
ncbi:MAG: N-acetyltransferase [Pedobacter sp.]|nr:MAG: N-acetyltransferase [Pedobacter sp.]